MIDSGNQNHKINLNFKGQNWIPYVVRNMSFWHMYANFPGYYKYFKDFGLSIGLEVVSITLDGIHTHTFVNEKNLAIVGEEISKILTAQGGVAKVRKLFKSYATKLLKSLEKVTKNLNKKNWDKFVVDYQKFTVALNFTAVFGRFGMNQITEKLLGLGFKEGEIPNIIATATYPKEHTPLFSSQLDLYKISKRLKDANDDEQFKEKELKKWLKNYGHIPVNFCNDPWTFEDAKNQFSVIHKFDSDLSLAKMLADHNQRVLDAKTLQKELKDKEVISLARAIGHATILNEFRKNVFCRVWAEIRDVFKEVAKRGGSDNWRDGFYINHDEMTELLFGEPFDLKRVVNDRKVTAHYVFNQKVGEMSQDELKPFLDHIYSVIITNDDKKDTEFTEIKGYSACRGVVRGTVKVVFGSKDFHKVERGDILVAPATSVDFVPVMEKAAAFVTNEGGITSHASIVSREMSKPCIIGTKIATKVLRDGMRVEVDAEHGLVTVIERKK